MAAKHKRQAMSVASQRRHVPFASRQVANTPSPTISPRQQQQDQFMRALRTFTAAQDQKVYGCRLLAEPSFLGGMAGAFDLWGKLFALSTARLLPPEKQDALLLAADRRAVLQDHMAVRQRLYSQLMGQGDGEQARQRTEQAAEAQAQAAAF